MQVDYRIVDLGLVSIANLVMVLIIGIMLSRPFGLRHLERRLGLVSVACALPVALAAVLNALGGRAWWTVVLPLLLVAFLVLELILDYLLKLDFRHTRLLGPYLLLYYVALMGMIGYSFGVSDTLGFITLTVYLANLLATWWSYARVGHGSRVEDRPADHPPSAERTGKPAHAKGGKR
jgi:hypothetical protein